MKLSKLTILAIVVMALVSGGCASATKQFSKRLVGTWQIASYNVERPAVRSAAAPPSDFGTITFNKDKSGSLENPSIFGNIARSAQNYRFQWNNTENLVVIKAQNAEVSKSWIVMTNKKDQQVWKSTDGANAVHTIELRR